MSYDEYSKLSEDDKQLYDMCADYGLANRPVVPQSKKTNIKHNNKIEEKQESQGAKLSSLDKRLLLELISHKQISILCHNHMDYNSKKYTELELLKIKVNDLYNK